MSKPLNVALMAAMASASCDRSTEVEEISVEVAAVTTEVNKEADWTCQDYLKVRSDGQSVVAVLDCREMIDLTGKIRAIDPSLAKGGLELLDYNVENDALLLRTENDGLWIIRGVGDNAVLGIADQAVRAERFIY